MLIKQRLWKRAWPGLHVFIVDHNYCVTKVAKLVLEISDGVPAAWFS